MGKFSMPYAPLNFYGEKDWELYTAFSYTRNNGDWITCPCGMRTDLASIGKLPAIIKGWLGKIGRHTKAAIIHDGLYRDKAKVYRDGKPIKYDRYQSDETMREAMIDTKEKPLKREAIYWGMRIGGKSAWRDGHQPVQA